MNTQTLGRHRPPNTATRWFVVAFGALLLLVGTLHITIMYKLAGPSWPSHDLAGTYGTGDATTLVVNAGQSDVTITDGPAGEISWRAVANADPRTLTGAIISTVGDTITVEMGRHTAWFGWFGWPEIFVDRESLDVTVPSDWTPDLRLTTSTGEARIDGTWRDLQVDTGVGHVTIDASAESLSMSIGVGEVDGKVTDVTGRATIEGGVGETDLEFGGASVPSEIRVEGGVGNVTLRLPATTGGYVVDHSGGIGNLQNQLPQPDPDGIPTNGPVPVRIEHGVGDVTLLRAG